MIRKTVLTLAMTQATALPAIELAPIAAAPAYLPVPTGAVRPLGWIEAQMRGDLHDGLKGNFPKITRNVTQRLFATQGRKPGTWVEGARGRKEKAWWAGEHEGYWLDSVTRSAIQLGDEGFLGLVRERYEEILDAYDRTGYIGIYDAESRLPEVGFDGELWTQSRLFQGMLAWHEFTGDQRVLDAVVGTVRLTIDRYRAHGTYFGRPGPDGGVTHAVGYMDTLEWLWRLTGDAYFAEAAVWLYQDFSENSPEDFDDLSVRLMSDREYPWCDHGAHVGEALHMPRIAHFFSGNADFARAADHVLPKLFDHTNPAGGMAIGYLEAVAGAEGGGHVLNENCAHAEALMVLNQLFPYQPDPAIGAWQEHAIFNVVQGVRFHPVDRALTYLSQDNRPHAADAEQHGGRHLFSPCHEAAACCVLNLPRVMPYYVQGIWYRKSDGSGLLANGYGPSVLDTVVGGVLVVLRQNDDYPFTDKITLQIDPERPVEFTLELRIPENAGTPRAEVAGEGGVFERDGDLLRIRREWAPGDTVSIDFDFQVVRKIQHDGREAYWMWGPLVFAVRFPHEKEIRAEVSASEDQPSGFHEYLVKPEHTEGWNLIAPQDAAFTLHRREVDSPHPYVAPPVVLRGTLADREWNPVEVELVPMGSAPLRRTTFPFHHLIPSAPGAKVSHDVTVDDDPMRAF